jgi:hypothetical protein
MKTLCSRKFGWVWFVAFVLLMGACANPTAPSSPVTRHTASPTSSVTATLQSSPTPSPTSSPSTAPEATLTKTPTATRTPTWTPVPTLLPEEAQTALKELFANNGDCQLPCWWGITPGETSWAQANEKLAPIAVETIYTSKGSHGITLYQPIFRIPEGINFPTKTSGENDFTTYYFDPSIFVKDSTVLAIDLSSGWISQGFDYSLAALLGMWGQPNEIWIRVNSDVPPEYTPEYIIRLFYPTRGILLSSGGFAPWQDNRLQICPQEFWDDTSPPGVVLWSPNLDLAFSDINDSLLGGIRNTYMHEHVILEDLNEGFDTASFYKTYLDPGTTTCFEVTP